MKAQTQALQAFQSLLVSCPRTFLRLINAFVVIILSTATSISVVLAKQHYRGSMTPAIPTHSHRPPHKTHEDEDEVRPYVIVGDIGKGSFATVYKGYHEVSCSAVSVHLISPINIPPGDKAACCHQDCKARRIKC